MFQVDITKWVPKFLLADKNGYAIAKAMEAGLQYMNDVAAAALALITDCETMPEWRLDELAWEYNLPYDYDADLEVKRNMIRGAYESYRMWGTKTGIENYLKARFSYARIATAWDYWGHAYHFRAELTGSCIAENDTWVKNAIERVKNVRSVLDSVHYEEEYDQELLFASSLFIAGKETIQVDAGDALTLDCYADEDGDMLGDEDEMPLIVEDIG